ncbi:MAG: hypothetical protein J2P28_14205 [Actinobacteria bacterium]|nr:hypothetical protein [Actinomycetota bacterium]
MAGGCRRKCKSCKKLFRPDPRNLRHQQYCSEPDCRAASKAARQVRWLAKPANRDYFRGPTHRGRNQDWRAAHPGYWRKYPRTAKKDVSTAQLVDSDGQTGIFARSPQQDVWTAQHALLIGLIAHLAGTAQQDDIARTTDRLLRIGQDFLAMWQRPAAPP